MRILIHITVAGSLIALAYIDSILVKRLNLLEQHTEIVGQTLKSQQYALDVLTDLIRAK